MTHKDAIRAYYTLHLPRVSGRYIPPPGRYIPPTYEVLLAVGMSMNQSAGQPVHPEGRAA